MNKIAKSIGLSILLFCTSFNLSACNRMDLLLPLLGLAENGSASQVMVSQSEYVKRLTTTADSVQKASVQALSKSQPNPKWMLRVMVFGIGVNAQIGIGPFKIGAYPQVRFIFSNTQDSLVP